MKKKILTLITICLILVCFSINVFSDNEISQNEINQEETNSEAANKTIFEQKAEVDSKLNESNSRLEYVQSEISTSLQKVQELDDSINDYQNKYNELQSQISSLEAEISATQTELAKEYGISLTTISSRISEYNREKEIKTKLLNYESAENNGKKLKIMRSSSIIAEYLRKGLTIEQIKNIALKRNIIIPQKVIEKAIQRNEQLEKNKEEELNER